MSISERLEQFYRKLFAASSGDQEIAIFLELAKQLSSTDSFPEVVRYFTTRLDEVITKMEQLTMQVKPPGQFARLENPQAWAALAWAIVERKLPHIGRDLFNAMYEFQLARQAEHRRRLYKGVSLQNLGWVDYLIGEHTSSRRAVQLALVEEILNTLDMDESAQLRIVSANPSYQMLHQTFKIPTAELDTFIHFSREYARMHPERSAYPEGCYISYLRAKTVGRTHLAIDKMASVSNFNHAYFTSLLNMIGSSVTSGN